MEAESQPSGCCGLRTMSWRWLQRKVLDHFLEFGLVVATVVALVWPRPGDDLSQHKVGSFSIAQTVNICTYFAACGLSLDTRDIISATTAFRSIAYGLVAILVITPTLGFGIIMLPFEPMDFATGLAVFVAMPTTLSSGVAMVIKARGNTALALLLTIGSTLAGVATVPFLINLITVHGHNVHINTLPLLLKLLSTILLPLIVGIVLRELPGVRSVVKVHIQVVNLLANVNMTLLVWQMLSRSRDQIVEPGRCMEVGIIITAAVGVHLIYLVWNITAATAVQLPFQDKKAVVLMASQKTLPVALAVVLFMDEDMWDQGLLSVPCILAHMVQVLIDMVIVARWALMADGPAELDSVVTTGGSVSEDGPVKEKIKVVDNPLAARETPRDEGNEGSCGIVTVVDNSEPADSPGLCRSLQANSVSSEESFMSAHTVFSNGSIHPAKETPRNEPSQA